MKLINKLLYGCLTLLFSWQYGSTARAFHYSSTVNGPGTSTCNNYCATFGEKSQTQAGLTVNDYSVVGNFSSCHCFSTSEITIIKNCKNTVCPGTNVAGYKRAYLSSVNSSQWCANNERTLEFCYCTITGQSYHKQITSSGVTCQVCSCGYKCSSGGVSTQCPSGTYSDFGAYSCTTCPEGTYCAAGTCTPKECPQNPPATSAAGSSGIKNCYYPKDISISDNTGLYLFTSNCFYS